MDVETRLKLRIGELEVANLVLVTTLEQEQEKVAALEKELESLKPKDKKVKE